MLIRKNSNKSVKLVCAQSSAHLDEQKAARHLPQRYHYKDKMTLILNILNKEMSILAADDKAFAGGYNRGSTESNAIYDFNKITLHASEDLALGIAGNTQEHYYQPELFQNSSIDDVIEKIRKHMGNYLRVHNRPSLSKLESFEVNDGILTFYDKDIESYFTYTFLFSPVHNQNRLYRGKENVQIFISGSGSKTYEELINKSEIKDYKATSTHKVALESCIQWVSDVFVKVGAIDSTCGTNAKIFISTKTNTKFYEYC